MDKVTETSLRERVNLLEKLLLLALTAESYHDSKKVVVCVKKTALAEGKALAKSKYTLTDGDRELCAKYASVLAEVAKALSKAKKAEDLQEEKKALHDFALTLDLQLDADKALLFPNDVATGVTTVIDGAAAGAKKLGDLIEKGVQYVKDAVQKELNTEEE